MLGSILLASFFSCLIKAQEGSDNTSQPLSTYVSRPDIRALALNVSVSDGPSPGYVFICPYRANQTGPYIYDKSGNLVWSGHNASDIGREWNTHALRPCRYNGSTHLCMWKGVQISGFGYGQGYILNENYQIVETIESQDNDGNPGHDFHESYVFDEGETALLTMYENLEYDLTAYNVTSTPQWLQQGVFQEVNISTGEVLFEWHSLDHVSLSASHVMPGETEIAGNGTTELEAWDYFHINSVDKSPLTGNYIISVRHTSALYCVSGTNGTVLWTLSHGAENNTFSFSNFNFTFQHDARWIEENSTHATISLFDNASNDFNNTASESSGMIVSLDYTSQTATLVSQVFAPRLPRPSGILAGSQANYQVLEDGGGFIGWGSVPAISEYNAAGDAVFHAEFGSFVYNYRAYTGNWTGNPLDDPALAIPTQPENATSQVVAYVSWNGATRVQTWRFWGSTNNETNFSPLDSIAKNGFETIWQSGEYTPYIFAEALSEDKESLRNSSIVSVARVLNGTTVHPTPSLVPSPTTPPESSGTGEATNPSETGAAVRLGMDLGKTVYTAAAIGGVAVIFAAL